MHAPLRSPRLAAPRRASRRRSARVAARPARRGGDDQREPHGDLERQLHRELDRRLRGAHPRVPRHERELRRVVQDHRDGHVLQGLHGEAGGDLPPQDPDLRLRRGTQAGDLRVRDERRGGLRGGVPGRSRGDRRPFDELHRLLRAHLGRRDGVADPLRAPRERRARVLGPRPLRGSLRETGRHPRLRGESLQPYRLRAHHRNAPGRGGAIAQRERAGDRAADSPGGRARPGPGRNPSRPALGGRRGGGLPHPDRGAARARGDGAGAGARIREPERERHRRGGLGPLRVERYPPLPEDGGARGGERPGLARAGGPALPRRGPARRGRRGDGGVRVRVQDRDRPLRQDHAPRRDDAAMDLVVRGGAQVGPDLPLPAAPEERGPRAGHLGARARVRPGGRLRRLRVRPLRVGPGSGLGGGVGPLEREVHGVVPESGNVRRGRRRPSRDLHLRTTAGRAKDLPGGGADHREREAPGHRHARGRDAGAPLRAVPQVERGDGPVPAHGCHGLPRPGSRWEPAVRRRQAAGDRVRLPGGAARGRAGELRGRAFHSPERRHDAPRGLEGRDGGGLRRGRHARHALHAGHVAGAGSQDRPERVSRGRRRAGRRSGARGRWRAELACGLPGASSSAVAAGRPAPVHERRGRRRPGGPDRSRGREDGGRLARLRRRRGRLPVGVRDGRRRESPADRGYGCIGRGRRRRRARRRGLLRGSFVSEVVPPPPHQPTEPAEVRGAARLPGPLPGRRREAGALGRLRRRRAT